MNKFTHILVLLAMILVTMASPETYAGSKFSGQTEKQISATCEAKLEGQIRSSIAFDKTLRSQAVYVDV